MTILALILIGAGACWIAYDVYHTAVEIKRLDWSAFREIKTLLGFVPILIGVGLAWWW